MYEKILKRIDRSESPKQARRFLHIIVAATRPLSLQELNVVLALDEKLREAQSCSSCTDFELESTEPFEYRIKNMCGRNLVITDSKVYLLHNTAKEIFVSQSVDD